MLNSTPANGFILPHHLGGTFQRPRARGFPPSLTFQSRRKTVVRRGRGPANETQLHFFCCLVTTTTFTSISSVTLPSSSVWSPPGLWCPRQGPPHWAAWPGCPSACETSLPGRCSCLHSGRRRENNLSSSTERERRTRQQRSDRRGLARDTPRTDEGSHRIRSSRVPRRKTESPTTHSLTLTKLSLSLSNVLKTWRTDVCLAFAF